MRWLHVVHAENRPPHQIVQENTEGLSLCHGAYTAIKLQERIWAVFSFLGNPLISSH